MSECFYIWRATKAVGAWVPPIPTLDYIHDKGYGDIKIERKCRYPGDELLLTISNNAYIGWWYYKPDLYIRGVTDGNGRMVDHKNGVRFWD